MSMAMPAPDQATLAKRERIIAAMRAIMPGEGVIVDEAALRHLEIQIVPGLGF